MADSGNTASESDWEPERPWRTVVRLIFEPLPRVHALWGIVISVPIAAVAVALIARSVVVGVIVLLVVLLGLTFYAAVRIQRRLTGLEHIDFDLTCSYNLVPPLTVNGLVYDDNFGLWVTLQNHGRAAEFMARVENVQGVPREWGSPYSVSSVAWEFSLSKTEMLTRKERANLRFATFGRSLNPHGGASGFWFWIPASATYGMGGHGSGNQWLSPSGTITFDLYVVNVTFDKTKMWRGRITFQENNLMEFRIEDPTPALARSSRRPLLRRDRLREAPR